MGSWDTLAMTTYWNRLEEKRQLIFLSLKTRMAHRSLYQVKVYVVIGTGSRQNVSHDKHDTMNQYRTIKVDCINLERLSWTTLIQIPNLFCQQPDVQAIITLLPLLRLPIKARSVKDSRSAAEKLALSPNHMKEINIRDWNRITPQEHLYTNICVERKVSIFIMNLISLLRCEEQWFNLFQTMTWLDWYVDISKQLIIILISLLDIISYLL